VVLAPREDGPESRKIRDKLADPVTLEFVETPLGDVIDFLKEYTAVNIVLDGPALHKAGITRDTPVSIHVQTIQLEMALKILLGQYHLTPIIANDSLMITSLAEARRQVVPRAYGVADLVRAPDDAASLVQIVQRVFAKSADRMGAIKDRIQFIGTPATLVVLGNIDEHERVTDLVSQLRGRTLKDREAVNKLSAKLNDPVTLEFVETPLSDVVDFLKDLTGVNIVVERPALEEEGINSDTPLTIHVQSISLAAAIRIMLAQFNLSYMIDNDCLLITSTLRVGNSPVLRVFPVDKMLGAKATISGEEWEQLVSKLAEAEWQAQTAKTLPPSGQRFATGSTIVVRLAQGEWPAKVVEFKDGRYKVHFDGSDDATDPWIDPDQIANQPTFAETGPFVVAYFPPVGSLVVLMPRSLEESVDNLIGLMVKSAGAK
jgi:hypothetical protein